MNVETLRRPEGVTEDELGRLVAPLEILVPYVDNPRDPKDFDPDQSESFASLMNSINEVGVREAINVYPCDDDKLCMQSGHRRREAVLLINKQREVAYQARLELGELSPDDERPDDVKLITGLPISMSLPPASEFDLEADMWLSESQRQKWPTNRMVRFYRSTYENANDYLRDDTKMMAGRLGLPETRVKLLNTIVQSDVLYDAAIETGSGSLPSSGREKTMRSISRVADVIVNDRWSACVKATGLYKKDAATFEAVRALVVKKAKEYVSLRLPAGVALERTAPELRKVDDYPDDVIVAWLTGPGTIAERVLPTTVKGSQAKPAGDGERPAAGGEEAASKDAEDLVAVSARYKDLELSGMSVDELNGLIARLTEATNTLDLLLTAARAQRRARVG